MTWFLIIVRLIPYVALSGSLAYLLIFLPQSREYLTLIRETAAEGLAPDLSLRYLVNAVYYLLFCFLVGKSLQDIVYDSYGEALSKTNRVIFFLVFVLLFATPIAILLHAIWSAEGPASPGNFVAGALALCVVVGVIVIALKMSRSTLIRLGQRPKYFTPFSITVCVALIAILFVANSFDVVGASHFFGTVGILVGTLAFLQGAILVLARYRETYPVFSIVVSVIIAGYVASSLIGPRELKAAASKAQSVPETSQAFKDWIGARRDRISSYAASHGNKKYPIFIVAAQGGGYYAAHHTALFLARLQDRCPEFAAHTFAISSVSGGSLGAAVFAEAMRERKGVSATIDRPCLNGALAAQPIETTVQRFFDFDFLTPLVASTLLFDIPNALVPALRLGPDRGTALQQSFEAAWAHATGTPSNGFSDRFYGRWNPSAPVPALFLNTTSVNLGIPTLISELDLRASSRYTELSNLLEVLKKTGDPDLPILRELQKHIGYSQLSFVNTLQFSKAPAFSLSFAITASARFPYVTPSSLIKTDADAENDLFAKLKYLQLLDGGMIDNSGLFTASKIKKVMDGVLEDPELSDLKDKVSIHLINFSHEAVALYKPGDEESISEVFAPLAAFDRIRMSRRSSYEALKNRFPDGAHEVVLFDGAFNAPLSWSLSNQTKAEIERRAGGIEDANTLNANKVCCLVSPGPNASPLVRAFTEGKKAEDSQDGQGMLIALTADETETWKRLSESGQGVVNRTYVPNSASFTAIIRELGYGSAPRAERAQTTGSR
jgi:hypothetical protein